MKKIYEKILVFLFCISSIELNGIEHESNSLGFLRKELSLEKNKNSSYIKYIGSVVFASVQSIKNVLFGVVAVGVPVFFVYKEIRGIATKNGSNFFKIIKELCDSS